MDREFEWIKTALSRDKTKTQSGLAAALGIDKSSVSRLLSGGRRLKFAEARLAAAYLGIEPPMAFVEGGEDFAYPETPRFAGQKLAPIFRAETASDGFWRLDRRSVVERKPVGPQLCRAPSVFGLYAPDDAMAPRFKAGEIAWINPMRPAAPGDDALLLSAIKAEALETVLLCELTSVSPERLASRQHSQDKDRNFTCDDWRALYVYPRA